MDPKNFFAELKRRNVYKVAVAYAVVAWLVIQAASIVLPTFEAPAWTMKVLIAALAIGFPIAVVLAWAFEITPEGIVLAEDVPPEKSIAHRTGRKLTAVIVVVAVIAAGMFAFQLFKPASSSTVRDTAPAAPAPVASSPAPAIPHKSIAVLPFENLSDDRENAYFSNGVQDEILTTLAKVADLKVISRTSVMQFREPAKRNLSEIAQALKVAHILEGSVQRSSNRVRVTAQLIDARTDTHLWAERYDRELADVFAIQSEIAQKIAEQLRAVLSPREQAAIQSKPTTNMVAYDLYLRGKEISRKAAITPEQLHEGVRLLDEAVQRDPAFVSAFYMLARAHLRLYWHAFDETAARLELAKAALDAAALLQPDAGEVHLARAFFLYWGKRDCAAALAELALARRALPNDGDAVHLTGNVQRRQGRWDEATRSLQEAAALDPRNNILQIDLALTYRLQRRFIEAAQVLDRALALEPNDFTLQRERSQLDFIARADLRRMREVATGEAVKSANPDQLAQFRMQLGLAQRDYRAAQEALAAYRPREINQVAGYVVPREWYEGLIALGLGNPEQARASFLAARERAAARIAAQPNEAVALVVLAQIDARLGRKEEAIRQVERALELMRGAGNELDRLSATNRLAAICAQVGEIDRALDLLEQTAQQPNGSTYGGLKLNAEWDPLRKHPRFEKIVASLAPKDLP